MTMEKRLTNQARRIFERFQGQLEPKYVRQLDEAIRVCEEYQQGVGNWGDMYEVVLYDNGIWEYSEGAGDFSEEVRAMWVLETELLICSCWLGCQREHDTEPEDMQINGENIPIFIDYVESLQDTLPDSARIFEFCNNTLCY